MKSLVAVALSLAVFVGNGGGRIFVGNLCVVIDDVLDASVLHDGIAAFHFFDSPLHSTERFRNISNDRC